jgi:drug/metabolite transporter (DMT)-like permease
VPLLDLPSDRDPPAWAWMIAASVAFAGMNVVIRWTSDELHSFQIVFFRNLFGLMWMAPWLIRFGRQGLGTRRIGFYVVRSLFGLVGMLGSFWAVSHMPLASATALSFTAPLFATIGAAIFLHEKVRIRRWTATLLGFAGMLVILRPGVGAFDLDAAAALVAAAASACTILIVKSLSRTEPPSAIYIWMVLFLAPMSLPTAIWVWRWPSPEAWGLMLLLGLLGTIGHLCVTRAYAKADATAVLPFDYLRLPCVALAGFVLFAEAPDVWVFVGTAIIGSSSVYIAWRERQRPDTAGVAGRSAPGDGAPKTHVPPRS